MMGDGPLEAMEVSEREGHSVSYLSDHAGKGHRMIGLRLENELLRSKFPGDYLRSWAKRDSGNTDYVYPGILTAGKKAGRWQLRKGRSMGNFSIGRSIVSTSPFRVNLRRSLRGAPSCFLRECSFQRRRTARMEPRNTRPSNTPVILRQLGHDAAGRTCISVET